LKSYPTGFLLKSEYKPSKIKKNWCWQTNIIAENRKERPVNFIHLEGISGSRRPISEGQDFPSILSRVRQK
jgi:hypothetical protein